MIRTETIGAATLYLADCRSILADLRADALVTDQPYGIDYKVNARGGRGKHTGLVTQIDMTTDFRGAIEGDDEPFDPEPFLAFRKMAFFGANHCAYALPPGGRWIVWDKRRDSKPDDHSDCELIWTNVPGADRIHRQKWRGIVREGEENISRSRKLHTNQKPVALMTFILEQIGARPGDTILDPFMGSGSTGIAALRMGMRFVGVEKAPEHFETACRRFAAEQVACTKGPTA